jgi:hypothetical protein
MRQAFGPSRIVTVASNTLLPLCAVMTPVSETVVGAGAGAGVGTGVGLGDGGGDGVVGAVPPHATAATNPRTTTAHPTSCVRHVPRPQRLRLRRNLRANHFRTRMNEEGDEMPHAESYRAMDLRRATKTLLHPEGMTSCRNEY